jgi:hypothetical protein
MTESTEGSSVPIGPEPGPLARVIGVFTSPAKTFESIARKPGWDWLVPVVLVMIASFIAQSAMLPKMDIDDAVKTQMRFIDKMAKGSIPEAKRAEIEAQTRQKMEASTKPVRRALNTLFLFIPLLLVPAIYHGLAAAFGAKTSYFKTLNGYAYTTVIQVVPLLLTAAVAFPQATLDTSDIQFFRVLKSNVAAFMPWETTNKALLGLLSSVDVFDIWAFLIGSIAVSKVTRFSPKGARWVVAGVWGFYIVCKMIGGAMLSAFMG